MSEKQNAGDSPTSPASLAQGRMLLTLFTLILLLLSPPLQAKKRKPDLPEFVHSDFTKLGIVDVHILPVVDHRQDRDFQGEFQKPLLKSLRRVLKHKKYTPHLPEEGPRSEITEDEVARPSPSLIKKLAPSESHWLLLPVLLRLERHTNIYSKGTAAVRLYIFDARTGDLLWQDSGDASAKTGVFLTGLADNLSIERATLSALDSLPRRKKKKGKSPE